ncbi:MAG: hypothetical protein IKA09_11420 [Lachnospiraceae bacterium]|nr:hypothetical protein [Lachnospiraceae bacterium]
MQSRMEQLIDEMEQYIASCKPQAFSKENIIVDRYHMEELLDELKRRTPEELKRYQKIMAQKDAILDDARSKAEALVNKATVQTNELVSEHEIMQQAHVRAQEVETMARQKAQELVDAAAAEANAMRIAAVQYTDELLANIENLMAHAIQTTSGQYENMLTSLNQYRDVVVNNRRELRGDEDEEEYTYEEPQTAAGEISLM